MTQEVYLPESNPVVQKIDLLDTNLVMDLDLIHVNDQMIQNSLTNLVVVSSMEAWT